MPGVQDGVVGHLGELLGDAPVERRRVAAGQVGAAATLEEQRVAGDQSVVDEEALAARGVPGGVDQFDVDLADPYVVAAGVFDDVALAEAGHLADELGLLVLGMDRHGHLVEQLLHPGDVEAHHRAANVVRVVVGGEYSGTPHAVGLENLQQGGDVVGRVDDDRLARVPVADQVHEVDHLLCHPVGGAEVAAGQQLPEVEPVVGCRRLFGRRGAHGCIVGSVSGRLAVGGRCEGLNPPSTPRLLGP